MSWVLDFVGIAIIGLFCLFLPFILIGMGVNDILAGIIGFSSCVILWLLFLNRGGQKRLQSYEQWKKIATDKGLEESNNANPSQVVGNYRNHRVRILGDPRSGAIDFTDQRPLKTLYVVEFENPNAIQIYIKKRLSLAVMFHGHDSFMSYMKDIETGDAGFDQQFVVKGNNENDVKAILDRSIRNNMINAKFNEAEIGYIAFWSDEKSQSSIPKWMESRFAPWALTEKELILADPERSNRTDEAHYVDTKTLDRTKQDSEGFKAIIDTMIDIVEKIESYKPSG